MTAIAASGDIAADATGGPGGTSDQANGGTAGAADLRVSLTATGPVAIFASAIGGAGGSSNSSSGAIGAAPRLQLSGTSTGGLDVTISGKLIGGDGGNAVAHAGDGASVSAVNTVNGNTTGNLNLSQTVIGGNGGLLGSAIGAIGSPGQGGTASSDLSKTASTGASQFVLDAVAEGGVGGGTTFGAAAGSGGDAIAFAQGTQTGLNISVTGQAVAGSGGGTPMVPGGVGGPAARHSTSPPVCPKPMAAR